MLIRVLLIDDSKFSRNNMKRFLSDDKYEIIGEAVDGLDGLEQYKSLQPDLIITDLEMPNLDGIGMIKEIRKIDSKAKIVIVTSVVNAQIIKEASRLQASVVTKPIKNDRLLNVIKLLDR